MDINKKIGLIISRERKEKKLSREQVARRVGVTTQCIEKYEKGKVNIPFKRLIQVCNAMGICITIFLKKEDDNSVYEHFCKNLHDEAFRTSL